MLKKILMKQKKVIINNMIKQNLLNLETNSGNSRREMVEAIITEAEEGHIQGEEAIKEEKVDLLEEEGKITTIVISEEYKK